MMAVQPEQLLDHSWTKPQYLEFVIKGDELKAKSPTDEKGRTVLSAKYLIKGIILWQLFR